MKVTNWDIQRDGETVTIIAGPLIDVDLQGGLEARLWEEVAEGAMHIRIALGGMKFLHASLTACLLAIQKHLSAMGGDVVLLDFPAFARNMFRLWGVENRFLYASSSIRGPLYYTSVQEADDASREIQHRLKIDDDLMFRFLG